MQNSCSRESDLGYISGIRNSMMDLFVDLSSFVLSMEPLSCRYSLMDASSSRDRSNQVGLSSYHFLEDRSTLQMRIRESVLVVNSKKKQDI